jgi:acetyl esterase/lipase
VGHSAGGALALIIAAGLPDDVQITGIILIVPAISPSYDTGPALAHCERGIWNVRSLGDCIYLGLLTTIFGTVDGKHVPAAGALGFPKSVDPRVRDVPYQFAMLRDANFGGHLSCTNRRFVRKWIAPLIAERAPGEKIGD